MFRFDPYRELGVLQNEMNHILDRLGRRGEQSSTAIGWVPQMDIYEDDQNFVLYADLPGMTREDIELHLENRTLTIRGERKPEKELKRENFHQMERDTGRFARSFTLPQTIESEKISASFKEGVLTVVLPKADEIKPRTIKING